MNYFSVYPRSWKGSRELVRNMDKMYLIFELKLMKGFALNKSFIVATML